MEAEKVNEGEQLVTFERRYAILQVTPEFLVSLCKGTTIQRVLVEENVIPPDSRVVGVGPIHAPRMTSVFDASHGIIGIVIESATFEDIPAGLPLPILQPPKFKLIAEIPKGIEQKCPACGELSLSLIDKTLEQNKSKIECAKCGWMKYT